jgi:hypothetical protein
MAVNPNYVQITTGLGTVASYTASTTDEYLVQGTLTIPTIQNGGVIPSLVINNVLTAEQQPSQVIATVNKNGSPVYTSLTGMQGFKTRVSCTTLDVITVVLSSSNTAVDAMPNAIKSTITISRGL